MRNSLISRAVINAMLFIMFGIYLSKIRIFSNSLGAAVVTIVDGLPCPHGSLGWQSDWWKQHLPVILQLIFLINSSFQHLVYDARWASGLATYYLAEYFANQYHGYSWRAGSGSGHKELITWPLKLDIEQHSIVPLSCHHQCVQAHQYHCTHHSPHQRPSVAAPSWRRFSFAPGKLSVSSRKSVAALAVVSNCGHSSHILTMEADWN